MVSIVVITYKHEKHILQTLESILVQTLPEEWELIIANDASPDNSDKIITNFIGTHPLKNHIRYYCHAQNMGMMPNFRYALSKAKYNYIAICEGDDFWIDNQKIMKQLAFLKQYPTVDFLFTNGTLFDNASQTHSDGYWSQELFQEGIISKDLVFQHGAGSFITSSLVISQKVMQAFVKQQHTMTDVFLLLHASLAGDFGYLNDRTTAYRINAQEAWSSQNDVDFIRFEKELLKVIKDENDFVKSTPGIDKNAFKKLQEGQYIIIIRHAYKLFSNLSAKLRVFRKYSSNLPLKTRIRLLLDAFKNKK